MNVAYPGPVCNNTQIRLDSLAGRSVRTGDTTCGLDGQTSVGVSFDARNLYFARYCEAAPVSCGHELFGAFRYSLKTARYSLARFGRRLTGFSYDGSGRAYEVLATDTNDGYCGNSVEGAPLPDCQIVLTNRLTFAAARAPRSPGP